MRIRRRPQTFSFQKSSDPSTSTAPQTPQNAAARNREWMQGGKEDDDVGVGRMMRHANVDLGKKSGVARRLALLQQDNGVDSSNSKRPGAEQGAVEDTHRSVPNGHCAVPCTGGEAIKSEPAPVAVDHSAAGDPTVSNGVMVAVKDEKGVGNGGGGKKRRGGGAAVLKEGSRCSRVNGRGWRCSQPTLVGYALCEHHLGKGRMRSVTGGGGASQLGRTEHRAATSKADEPSLGH
uniref:WRC domain-containing protein n=1 Tax=Leersia perrieri TaxID=77586 RepID=A0A0D9WN33_9ORYZ